MESTIRRIDPKDTRLPSPLTAQYVTPAYFDLEETTDGKTFSWKLTKKQFPKPIEKSFDFELAPDYFLPCEDYGILEGERVVGLIELHVESWNNRLRITELWVDEPFRTRGFGGMMLEFAKNRARELNCRGLILETQSCNVPAISCYWKHGFRWAGLDSSCYSNRDIERKEVRLEMGFLFSEGEEHGQ